MIRVLHNYGGANTRERRIEPGGYADDDPRLFGLADYLVEHGHAIDIPVETDEHPGADGDRDGEDAELAPDDADYQAMTKGQLLNIATAGGLELSDRLSKQAIIGALIAHGKE